MNLKTYTLPAYWGSYLINGDDSGMSDADKRDCAAFLAREGLSAHRFVDCGEQFSQSHNDATTLAGDVCEYTYDAPAESEVTDTQRLEFALQNGLFVSSVETGRFTFTFIRPMNPIWDDIDRAIASSRNKGA